MPNVSALAAAALLLLLPATAHAAELSAPRIQQRIDALSAPYNVSASRLLVEPASFVHAQHDVDSDEESPSSPRPALRVPPKYKDRPKFEIKVQLLNLMKQAIYSTEGRIHDLDEAMSAYHNGSEFQQAFVYSRLEQLVLDARRIYTQSYKGWYYWRTYSLIVLYAHSARKHIDVLYLVEFFLDTHERIMK